MRPFVHNKAVRIHEFLSPIAGGLAEVPSAICRRSGIGNDHIVVVFAVSEVENAAPVVGIFILDVNLDRDWFAAKGPRSRSHVVVRTVKV